MEKDNSMSLPLNFPLAKAHMPYQEAIFEPVTMATFYSLKSYWIFFLDVLMDFT